MQYFECRKGAGLKPHVARQLHNNESGSKTFMFWQAESHYIFDVSCGLKGGGRRTVNGPRASSLRPLIQTDRPKCRLLKMKAPMLTKAWHHSWGKRKEMCLFKLNTYKLLATILQTSFGNCLKNVCMEQKQSHECQMQLMLWSNFESYLQQFFFCNIISKSLNFLKNCLEKALL